MTFKAANVFGIELIGRFAEVSSKLGDPVQISPDSGGRVMTNMEILEHPLSKCSRALLKPVFWLQFATI